MKKDQIVIVTNINDPHTDDVLMMLQSRGYEAIRLNTDDIPSKIGISLGIRSTFKTWKGTVNINSNGRVIYIDNIRSIWWRRPLAYHLPTDLTVQEYEFATDEIDHVLHGLWSSLDCYWISYPEYIRRATWKVEQLQRADAIGFNIPRTLVTTEPEEARAFYDACDGQVIYKVMSDPLLAAPKTAQKYPELLSPEPFSTYTTLITETELALLDSVRLAPCMFQEYIPKQVELRVTIIGDDIFVAAIHSQEHEKTQIDWRHFDVDITYQLGSLPTEITEKCFAFVKSYNLNFSALDFILTPDGRYVFIENNPNGQFIFIEERVPALRMTEALTQCLIRGSNS
jgi:hypothetical protein